MRYFVMLEGSYLGANVNYNYDTTRPREHDTNCSPEYFPVCKRDVICYSEGFDLFTLTINFDQKVAVIDDDKIAKITSYATVQEWNEKHKTMPMVQDDYQQTRAFYQPIPLQIRGIQRAEQFAFEIPEHVYKTFEMLYRTNQAEYKTQLRKFMQLAQAQKN